MKHLQISIPEGYEIDKAQSTFENIVFKPTVISLPKTWEELNKINGYFVHSGNTSVIGTTNTKTVTFNRDVFATEEQAQASIALAQLSQLMKVYNDGWVPDWNDGDSKYVLRFNGELVKEEVHWSTQHFLAFKSKEIRKEFLENFKDLITIAKPLL